MFPLALNVEGLRETKLTVSLGASHFSAYSLNPKDQVEIASLILVNCHDRWNLKFSDKNFWHTQVLLPVNGSVPSSQPQIIFVQLQTIEPP